MQAEYNGTKNIFKLHTPEANVYSTLHSLFPVILCFKVASDIKLISRVSASWSIKNCDFLDHTSKITCCQKACSCKKNNKKKQQQQQGKKATWKTQNASISL